MYLDEYKRWLAADLEDSDLHPELAGIEGNDDEIKDRFAVALKFGTAGLRGVLGAGTNRMNIYVVRQATQGLANWVKTQGGNQTVAISYDSRIKSDVFAKTAAAVLAANGIKVRIYDALMPVPALSFATRYYECNAGIMVTASHNPAKYNGYKAYGPDGSSGVSGGGPAAGVPVCRAGLPAEQVLRCPECTLPARKGQGKISLQRVLLVRLYRAQALLRSRQPQKSGGGLRTSVHRPRRAGGLPLFQGDGKPRVHRHCGHPGALSAVGLFQFQAGRARAGQRAGAGVSALLSDPAGVSDPRPGGDLSG